MTSLLKGSGSLSKAFVESIWLPKLPADENKTDYLTWHLQYHRGGGMARSNCKKRTSCSFLPIPVF